MSLHYSMDYSQISSLCIEKKGIPEANRDLFRVDQTPTTSPITVSEFRELLLHISQERGKGSRDRIYNHITSLWKRCTTPQEIYFSSMYYD